MIEFCYYCQKYVNTVQTKFSNSIQTFTAFYCEICKTWLRNSYHLNKEKIDDDD